MKTKKTYTRSSITLLVGLLSLHTLSSCVHTGKQLDMKKYQYSHVAQRERSNPNQIVININDPCVQGLIAKLPTTKNLKGKSKETKLIPVGKKKKCLYGIAIGTLVTSALGILYFIGNPFSGPESITNTTGASIGNGTTAVGTTQEPLENLVNTTADVVTTLGSLVIPALNMTGMVAAFRPNEVNSKPIVLTQNVIDALSASGYSKASIEEFLRTNGDIDAIDKRGITLLMHTAQSGQPGALQFLIDRGAQVDAENEGGNTAMMFAALAEKKENIEILLKNGASPCIQNHAKATAKFYAQIRRNEPICNILEEAEQKCS